MKVYQYGLRPPITNAQLVRDQMRSAHRYRNLLVEIARGERQAARDVIGARVQAREQLVLAAQKTIKTLAFVGRKAQRVAKRESRSMERRYLGAVDGVDGHTVGKGSAE